MMPKNSSPGRAVPDKRAAARTFWMTVLGGVLGTPAAFWLFRAIGVGSNMPAEADLIGMGVCLAFFLIFMFTHRNADGTVRWSRVGTRSVSKAPQGKKTMLLIAATGALYWLLVNQLHLSENMLSLARIVLSATIAVLCVRYVLRWRKPGVCVD
jgi:hypothetical protein